MSRWARVGGGARTRLSLVVAAVLVASLTIAGHTTTAGAASDRRGPDPADRQRDAAGDRRRPRRDRVRLAGHRPDARRSAILLPHPRQPAADDPARVGRDRVDTGRVRSAQQAFVPYSGPRLQGDVQYWWTVSTGDATGAPGPFARPVAFVTVPRTADWHAQWVTPGASPPSHDQFTYVRTTVHVGSGPIVRATAYVAAVAPVSAVDQRQRAAARAVVLVSRRAVRRGDRRHRACCGPGAENGDRCAPPLVRARARAGRHGAARAARARSTSSHRDGIARGHRHRRHVARARRPSGSRRAAQRRGRLHRDRRRAARTRTVGPRPGSTTPRGSRSRCSGRPERKPFTQSGRAAHPHREQCGPQPVSVRTLPSGAVVADYGAIDAATPGRCAFRARRRRAGRSRCAPGTCSTPTGPCRRPTRTRAPT